MSKVWAAYVFWAVMRKNSSFCFLSTNWEILLKSNGQSVLALLPWVQLNGKTLQVLKNSLDLTNSFWSRPIHFGHDHFILVVTKSLWSSPNQFGQTKTILDRPKLFWSHRRTRHFMGATSRMMMFELWNRSTSKYWKKSSYHKVLPNFCRLASISFDSFHETSVQINLNQK